MITHARDLLTTRKDKDNQSRYVLVDLILREMYIITWDHVEVKLRLMALPLPVVSRGQTPFCVL